MKKTNSSDLYSQIETAIALLHDLHKIIKILKRAKETAWSLVERNADSGVPEGDFEKLLNAVSKIKEADAELSEWIEKVYASAYERLQDELTKDCEGSET